MEQQNEQAVRAVLEAFGLPELRVVADPAGIAVLERRPGSVLRFAEALRRGLEAFLCDTQGSPEQGQDSAHDDVRVAAVRAAKAMLRPSGDQAARPGARRPPAIVVTAPPASSRLASAPASFGPVVKATLVPSGDQVGQRAPSGRLVSWRRSAPSERIRKSCST